MIAISLFIQLASNKKNKKRIMVNLVICFIFGVIFLDFIITFLFSQFLPLGAINLKMALNSKLNSIYYGSILFRWAVQIATVLFGAFPSFSREVTFSIMYNSGLLFKGMLSFYLVLGIIKIIKNFRYEYYSIVIYVVMGIFFCTVWGVALNMRFQITFFPFMLPIMAYSLQKFRVNRIAYYTHTILLSGLIIAYNAR
jgi:hypothetical protein